MGAGKGRTRRAQTLHQERINAAEKIGNISLAVREENPTGLHGKAILLQTATLPLGDGRAGNLVMELSISAEEASKKQYTFNVSARRGGYGRPIKFTYDNKQNNIHAVYEKSELESVLEALKIDTEIHNLPQVTYKSNTTRTMPDKNGEEHYKWTWRKGTLYAEKSKKKIAVMNAEDAPAALNCLDRMEWYVDQFADRYKLNERNVHTLQVSDNQVEKVTF